MEYVFERNLFLLCRINGKLTTNHSETEGTDYIVLVSDSSDTSLDLRS